MTAQKMTARRDPGVVSPVVTLAAAYCGTAHGAEWTVDGSLPPPDKVELWISDSPVWYRLARHPRTGRPAKDWHGRLLYVPALAAGPRPLGSSPQREVSRSAVRRPVFGWERLTERELRVARLAAGGLTNREIGARLAISPNTVVFHLRRLFTKLGARSRVELARAVRAHEPTSMDATDHLGPDPADRSSETNSHPVSRRRVDGHRAGASGHPVRRY